MCGSLRILMWLFLHVSSQIILLNSFISLLLACFLHLFAISLLAYTSSPISFIWDQFHMSVLGVFVLFFSLPQNSHCLPKISVRRISSGRQSPFVLPVCGHWSHCLHYCDQFTWISDTRLHCRFGNLRGIALPQPAQFI